jgi:hypothetical protein
MVIQQLQTLVEADPVFHFDLMALFSLIQMPQGMKKTGELSTVK